MTSTIEFIINFENPSVNVKVMGNKLSQLLDEVIFRVNIVSSDWDWYIGLEENSFST